MSDTKKTTKSETKAKAAETKPNESKSADATSAPATAESGDGGKSARESVGGAAVGHYGYFSNIKTPEYKSGWDDIWGKKKKSGGGKNQAAAKSRAQAKPKAPRVVSFDFEDLPADLQAALAKAARAQLKKSRINFDNRAKAGAVTWRIDCTVER